MMNTVLICALLLSKPYLQNVGTNGFSVCAETSRADRGLRLKWWTQAGRTNETAFVYSLADFSKTFKAVARVEGVPQGCKVGFEVAGERGEVKVWRDCDDDFTCAIYGDFQGGTWAGDPWWG